MNAYVQDFLNSALVGGEWSVSWPAHFTPAERIPSTHCIGCWMGPRTILDVMEKRKCFYRDSNSDSSVIN
jgi:hypothetical protein